MTDSGGAQEQRIDDAFFEIKNAHEQLLIAHRDMLLGNRSFSEAKDKYEAALAELKRLVDGATN